jgi:hypothetical protein
MLLGCTTPSLTPPEIIKIENPLPTPPDSYIIKCPETLEKLNIEEEEWYGYDYKTQVTILSKDSKEPWGEEYHNCAETHNALVDWIKDKLLNATSTTDTHD